MAERLAQMFENMRYAEAGVLVRRYVAGLTETEDDGRARQEAPDLAPGAAGRELEG